MAKRMIMIGVLLWFASLYVIAAGAPCPLNQFRALTQIADGYSQNVKIDALGKRVVWEGDGNPLGTNTDRNTEVFAYDVSSGRVTQVTHTTTGEADSPDISADGEWVAFASRGNPLGGNADGNREIFLYQWSSGAMTQVTETAGVNNDRPRLNGDGSRLAFISEANLAGTNTDGNQELFYTDNRGMTFIQVTDTQSFRFPDFPAINYLGDRIAFTSRSDFTGNNGDGNEEIFVFDIPSRTFIQVTASAARCSNSVSSTEGPVFDLSGNLVVFMSNCDFNGDNPDGSFEAYVADLTSGGIEQITQSTHDAFGKSISGDGRLVALTSWGGDYAGNNGDGSDEVFLFDRSNRVFTQPTNGAAGIGSYAGSLSVDGTSMGFSSSGNFDGRNPEGNYEPFLASCTQTFNEPFGANVFPHDPAWFPMLDSTAPGTSPIGLGPAAVGGDRFSLELRLGRFSSAVDLYVLVYMPAVDPVNIYSLSPDLRLRETSRGYLPWALATTGPFDESLFRYIPTSALPSGTYYFGLMATAPGNFSHYYLWFTSLALP